MATKKKRKTKIPAAAVTLGEFESIARFVTNTPEAAMIIGFTGDGSLVVSLSMGGDSRMMTAPNLYVIYESLIEAAAVAEIPGEKLQ